MAYNNYQNGNNNYQGGRTYQNGGNGQNGKRQSLGNLWQKKDKNGNLMFTGTINGERVIIFANGFKNKETSPDFIIYRSEDFSAGKTQNSNNYKQYNNNQQNWQKQAQQTQTTYTQPVQTNNYTQPANNFQGQQNVSMTATNNNVIGDVDINGYANGNNEEPFPAF